MCVRESERERKRESIPGMWERKRVESMRARRDLSIVAMAANGRRLMNSRKETYWTEYQQEKWLLLSILFFHLGKAELL